MGIVTTVVLSFVLIGFGALAAAMWSVWFPTTRCQRIRKDAVPEYNICIRVKSHEGPHMSADGSRF